MLNSKTIFNLIFIFSIFSISFALYLEFFLGYMPCKLCTYQRIPYYLLIVIGFINIFSKKYFTYLYLLLIILILSELILSGYHSLVTFEIIKYSGCESAILPSDITKLKEALLSDNLVVSKSVLQSAARLVCSSVFVNHHEFPQVKALFKAHSSYYFH